MDAQTLLRNNGAKAGELVLAIGGAAGAVAKAIEDAAGPLAELIEDRAETLAKTVEERTGPLAGTVGTKVDALAKTVEKRAGPLANTLGAKADSLARTVEERAVPLAGTVGTTVETLADDLEDKFEKARKDVTSSVRSFRFGTREGVILGMVLGVLAAVWLIKRMDREVARERLRVAGGKVGESTQALAGRVGEVAQGLTSRVGEATQGLPSRVSEATRGLSDKAGALANQAGGRVGQVAQTAGARAGEVLQQVRGGQAHPVEDAKLRLSDPTSPAREVVISESLKKDDEGGMQGRETDAGSDLDKDTQAAIAGAVEDVERAQDEALAQAQNLGLSDGMKVVGFDGTDIGRVQEVRDDVFVLDRPKGPDLLVPLTEVARIEGTVAYLRVEADRVVKMGWETGDRS